MRDSTTCLACTAAAGFWSGRAESRRVSSFAKHIPTAFFLSFGHRMNDRKPACMMHAKRACRLLIRMWFVLWMDWNGGHSGVERRSKTQRPNKRKEERWITRHWRRVLRNCKAHFDSQLLFFMHEFSAVEWQLCKKRKWSHVRLFEIWVIVNSTPVLWQDPPPPPLRLF